LRNSPQRLSVIVITKNEECNIVDCLKSASWAAEIVVVDAESSDRTVELARQFTKHVFVRRWEGYAESKNFALSRACGEWILWLDADERVTPELAQEIRETIQDESRTCDAYEVARRAYFLGKWMKHCGWYPGYVARLFRKNSAMFNDAKVHEGLNLKGKAGRLKNDLLHFTDDTLYHYFEKFNRYTSLAAEELAEANRESSLYDLIIRPPYLFCKMYFLRLGLLDGMHGLVLSLVSAAYVFTKYAKLWQLRQKLAAGA